MDASPGATNGTQKSYGGYKGLNQLTDRELDKLDQVGQIDWCHSHLSSSTCIPKLANNLLLPYNKVSATSAWTHWERTYGLWMLLKSFILRMSDELYFYLCKRKPIYLQALFQVHQTFTLRRLMYWTVKFGVIVETPNFFCTFNYIIHEYCTEKFYLYKWFVM